MNLNPENYTIWDNHQISEYAYYRDSKIYNKDGITTESAKWYRLYRLTKTNYNDLGGALIGINNTFLRLCHEHSVPFKEHPIFYHHNKLSKQDYAIMTKFLQMNVQTDNDMKNHDDSKIQKDLIDLNSIFVNHKLPTVPSDIKTEIAKEVYCVSKRYAIRINTPKILAIESTVKDGTLRDQVAKLYNKYNTCKPIHNFYTLSDLSLNAEKIMKQVHKENYIRVKHAKENQYFMNLTLVHIMQKNKTDLMRDLKYQPDLNDPIIIIIGKLKNDVKAHESWRKISNDAKSLDVGASEKLKQAWHQYLAKMYIAPTPKVTKLQKETEKNIKNLKKKFATAK